LQGPDIRNVTMAEPAWPADRRSIEYAFRLP
jgi:hypothetical protein